MTKQQTAEILKLSSQEVNVNENIEKKDIKSSMKNQF